MLRRPHTLRRFPRRRPCCKLLQFSTTQSSEQLAVNDDENGINNSRAATRSLHPASSPHFRLHTQLRHTANYSHVFPYVLYYMKILASTFVDRSQDASNRHRCNVTIMGSRRLAVHKGCSTSVETFLCFPDATLNALFVRECAHICRMS